MQPLAPQAFPPTGQAPALAPAGNALDGSSGPWRKEAGSAMAAGPAGQAATPAAKPPAHFTTLLESLVSAGEAGNAPAVKKEYGPRAAFWMAVATATPPVSQPAKPADDAAETKDETGANDSLPAERAPTPETSGDAAAALVKVARQSDTRLPVAIATPTSPAPDAPEDRASRDREGAEFRTMPLNFAQAAAPAIKNGAPDSKLAAAEAEREQETAGRTAAGAEAKFRQTGGARPAAEGTPDRNDAAAEQETTDPLTPTEDAPDGHRSPTLGAPIGAGPGGRPVRDGWREGTEPRGQRPGGAAAKSQRVRDVAQANTEDRQEAAAQQEAVRGRSDGLQVSSTAGMVPAQLPAGSPAGSEPGADRAPRPWREGRSPSPGATGKNGATNAGTVSGQPLAAPAVTGQTKAQSQSDANTGESGEEAAPVAGQPAANSALAASELPDDATGSSSARPMVVAFTARLRPVEAAPEAPSGEPANSVAEPIETAPVVDAAVAGETALGGQNNSHVAAAASTRQPDVSREPVRKPEVSAAGGPEPAVTARPATTPQPLASSDAKPRESAPDSPPPAAATEPAAAPEAPKPAAAHDIKLELAGQGDRRVEVRVSERAGDMRIEVRTPDSGLAGDLREDLPALATKLEQTGFRAETWHPAGTAERQLAAEAAPGAASQNSERQPGQNGGQSQRDPQQQPKPKAQENETPSQNAGKDFAWLFSSIP